MNIKEMVLQTLQENKDKYTSGESLSDSLQVSRAAIWKSIQSLRGDGYQITAVTNKGYRLLLDNNSLNAEQVRLALPVYLRKTQIYSFDVTDSTNKRCKQLLLDGSLPGGVKVISFPEIKSPSENDINNSNPCDHGTVILANQQTLGRGRLDRAFYSPDGGLYLSIILKPRFDMSKSVLVTVAAASAVVDAIEDICKVQAQIKWVNDIYISDKKVCGILTEAISDFESGQISNIIVGIGLNTSTKGFPKELTNIAGAVQGDFDKNILAAKIIENVLRNISQLNSEGTLLAPPFMKSYREHSLVIGREIKVFKGTYRQNPEDELGGLNARAMAIDDLGGLDVNYEDGTREILRSGEITIRFN